MPDLNASQDRETGPLHIAEVLKNIRSGMNHFGHAPKFGRSKSSIKEGIHAKRKVGTHIVGKKTTAATLQMNRADLSTQGSGGHLEGHTRNVVNALSGAANSKKVGSVSKRGFLKRRSDFRNAALFAEFMRTPLRLFITITWHACVFAERRNEGNVIGLPDEDRCRELRNRLRRKCKSLGIVFACIWARAVGSRHGEHIHLFMACPFHHERAILSVLERATGATHDPGYYDFPAIAASDCKGWFVVLNDRGLSGAVELAEHYFANQSHWHGEGQNISGKAFGTSQAIGRTSRNAAQWENVTANRAANVSVPSDKKRPCSQASEFEVAQ